VAYIIPLVGDLSKSAKVTAGRELFKLIWKYMYQSGNPNIKLKSVKSIGHLESEPMVRGFTNQLRGMGAHEFMLTRSGWDFWQTDSPINQIIAIWRRNGVTNIWHGNGVECEDYASDDELADLLVRKSLYDEIKKIYFWTITTPEGVKNALANGLDGVQTTQVLATIALINTHPYNQIYRLATPDDDQWKRYPSISLKNQSYASPAYSVAYATPAPLYPQPTQSYPPIYSTNYNQAASYPISYQNNCTTQSCAQSCSCNIVNSKIQNHHYSPNCMDSSANGCQCLNDDYAEPKVGVHWFCCDAKWNSGDGCSSDTS
jgi:hypothetical protein